MNRTRIFTSYICNVVCFLVLLLPVATWAQDTRPQLANLSETSQIEESFARRPVPVTKSLAGPGGRRESKFSGAKEGFDPLAELVTRQAELTPFEKVRLFQQLDAEQQQQYLLLLDPAQRAKFLRNLGEPERWFTDDLRSGEIDVKLKQFGYDFFETAAGGYVAEHLVPVGPDYVVGPGDTLLINVWGNLDAHYEGVVGRNGEIVLPKVGTFSVWGQTFAQVSETVRKQIARYYTGFELSVTLGQLRSIEIFVVGEANAPGTYTVSSLSTVLSGLSVGGGPARTGSLRDVRLMRNGTQIASLDFYNFFLNGDKSGDIRLQSGDTIFVPVARTQVGVAGAIRRPAIYELQSGETLQDVLRMAGGINSTAYLQKIQVERVEAHQRRIIRDFDLSGGTSAALAGKEDIILQDRDLVKISPIGPMTGKSVRLTGYVAHPGGYQLHEGMRVADLLLNYNNFLPSYYPDMVEILRLEPPELRPVRLTVNLEKALAGDPENNILLQEYDEVQIFSREEMEEIAEVQVTGSVLNPGSYRLYQQMTVKDLISAAGNVKRRAYLAEAEVTRFFPEGKSTRTERQIIDLAKALAGDPEQNIELHPNDHLFIRSIPDYGDRMMVKVNGEVLFPGQYAIGKGEKLSSVLERAGGFSPNAYLKGAIFSRESLKESQKKQIDRLILEQEEQIHQASAEIAAGALSPEEAASAKSILDTQLAYLNKLRQTPVTGRMVIRVESLLRLAKSDYDIEVMDGDSISIPENPRSVTVLGQVYNPTSLVYRPGKTVSHYLSQVGGTNRDAENSDIFIIRADGTVFSKQQAGMGLKWDGENNRWIAGGFNVTEIYPGDAILVPKKIKRNDFMREVKDISVIFYQMALGAAAVASF